MVPICIQPKLELLLAQFTGKDASVEPINPVHIIVYHQLVVIVLQTDMMGFGQVLVDAEVVTQDEKYLDRMKNI